MSALPSAVDGTTRAPGVAHVQLGYSSHSLRDFERTTKLAHGALEQVAGDSADPDEAMLLHRIRAEPNFAWRPFDGTLR